MKKFLIIFAIFLFAFIVFNNRAFAAVNYTQAVDDVQTSALGTSYYQPIGLGTIGTISYIEIEGQLAGGSGTMNLRVKDLTNATSTVGTSSVSMTNSDLQKYQFYFSSTLNLNATHQYAFEFQGLFFKANGSNNVGSGCRQIDASATYITDAFGSSSLCSNGVTSLYFRINNGITVNFLKPVQTLGATYPQTSDFQNWGVQVGNINTTTSMSLVVTTGLGSDTYDLSSYIFNSTSTITNIYFPKSYPLDIGASSTMPIYASVVLKNNSNGATIASNVTYFSVIQSEGGASGNPFYNNYNNSTTTGGSLFDLGGSNYVPPSTGTPISLGDNDWTRSNLGTTLPFVYFYQIADIVNSLRSDSGMANITPLAISTHIGGTATTSIPIFSDSITTGIVSASTWTLLKNLISAVMWLSLISYIVFRVKSLFQGSSTGD